MVAVSLVGAAVDCFGYLDGSVFGDDEVLDARRRSSGGGCHG